LIKNLKWACGIAAKYADTATAPAAPALEAAINDRSKAERADRAVPELKKLLMIVAAANQSAGLPPSFAGALKMAIDRSGLSLALVARESGVDRVLLSNWIEGTRNPTEGSAQALPKIEALLRLPDGALSDRHFVVRRRHDHAADTNALNDRDLDENPRYAFPADWGPQGLRSDRPSKWPSALVKQRDAFFLYRIDPHAPTKSRDPDAKPWGPYTVKMRDEQLGRIFGYFASGIGGFQIARDDLGFAFLVKPALHDAYRQHVAIEREKTEGVRRATRIDKSHLELLRAFFHPKHGWITQSPELAQQLKPIMDKSTNGWILSPDEITEIQADWPGACSNAFAQYDSWARATKITTDTEKRHKPIVAILELKDPLLAFRLGMSGVKAEIEKLDKNSIAYHLAVRDAVMWALQAQRALRRKNGAWLTYKDDNSGNVRKVDLTWRLKISAKDFKNGGGEYFGRGREVKDFDVLVLNVDGLYDLMQEYVTRSRPVLLNGRHSSAFLIGNSGKDLKSPGVVQAMTRIYRLYVRWNANEKTGIKGALNVTGVHWMRAVLATGILKLTNDRQLAADAIHDSVRTVEEHYLRYLPADRAQSLDRALMAGLGGA
jgi:transcriptional regulator with XRE-family HTH domain